MTVAKLCIACFREKFGQDAKIGTMTWSRECSACHAVTGSGQMLIKADSDEVA